ncbi:PREDICTED: uncharacterized protein LOC108545917 [Eufriesea mexicana]|uniref:uncharacterized protein LOC108545917 n=1 Tax=Eufriesea mexicana TaxID=516756 RepID=UPI00083BE329|nr:PREDICTED: uncharacterized protein LOC108545917 [Eufriesea mexicana]
MKMLPAIHSHLSHKRAHDANLPDESRGKIGFVFVSREKDFAPRLQIKRMKEIATLVIAAGLAVAASQEYNGRHALFVKTSSAAAHSRVQRAAPVSAADTMAKNILEWIQGIYRQGARKPRQQSDPPGYLPPYSTQRPPERPRPFQAPSTGQQSTYATPTRNEVTNYPYQRPSNVGSPSGQSTTVQPPPYSTQRPTYLPPNNQSPFTPSSYNLRPSATPAYSNAGSSAFPPFSSTPRPPSSAQTPQPGYPTPGGISTNYGYSTPGFSSSTAGTFSTPAGFSTTYGYSTKRPSPTYVPSVEGPALSGSSAAGYPSTGYPSGNQASSYPTAEAGANSFDHGIAAGYPPSSTPDGAFPAPNTGSGSSSSGAAIPSETSTGVARPTGEESSGSGTVTGQDSAQDDDSLHPPHIHALDVQCSKTMMTINIEFNRVFDGVIYSKGFFSNPECRYVAQNSGQTKYSFTVSLDSCGTQFINDFAGEAGQAYLENVLVLQNEPGIQEVWDTVRRVRCLWEGNINKALTVNFSVDMLNQEIVTFSGDTATAKLDIQVGRGPFAPAADGLVKIGETMTLVVSVEGDPGFDLQVRDCFARDESLTNTIQLTDDRGCVLKPKLFGAFQKTKDTGNTGASIIAYAYFQAFKFPDVMDLFIECNVELCKTDCEACPELNQQIEPRRRRRSIMYTPSNTTSNASTVLLSDPIRVARGFKVIMVDDLSKASNQVLEHLEETAIAETTVEEIARNTMNVCMTHSGFYVTISFFFTTILATTISAVTLYVKLQRVYRSKANYS